MALNSSLGRLFISIKCWFLWAWTFCSSLEALPVDDGGTGLVVLLLGDPHGLEGGEGGQDGASDPDGVLPLWWSNDLDLQGVGGKGGDLLLHTVSDAGVHGGTTGQNNVGVEVLPDVDVALHDGVVGGLVDANRLKTQNWGWKRASGHLNLSLPTVITWP